MWKPSKNPKVIELTKSCKNRTVPLDAIGPIKLEELNEKGKPRRLCAWCAEEELFHGNRKYCSTNCSNSAMAFAYPQKEDGLRFLLIRQDWKCAGCQFDYRPIMQSILDREKRDRYCSETCHLDDLPWHYFKSLKNKVESIHNPEVDHILAISKGGESLGLLNHQVLCYSCHKAKTKLDLSGKRPKKES